MKIRQNIEKQILLNILLNSDPKDLMDIKPFLILGYNIDLLCFKFM